MVLDNNYELFTKKGEKIPLPYIAILKSNYITVNKGAIQLFGLHPYRYASIFFSKNDNILKIYFSKNFEKGKCYSIIKRSTSYRIQCVAALKYFGVASNELRIYYMPNIFWDDSEKTISLLI